jgi:hypothetical protein
MGSALDVRRLAASERRDDDAETARVATTQLAAAFPSFGAIGCRSSR